MKIKDVLMMLTALATASVQMALADVEQPKGASKPAAKAETRKDAAKEKGGKGETFGDDVEERKPVARRAKKLPRKSSVYYNWHQAQAIALAWEQPVLAFIALDGDEACQKVRRYALLKPEFLKLFAPENVVLYQSKVEVLRERNRRRGGGDKKSAGKPDKESIRKSEKSFIEGLMGSRNWTFPKLVLVSPKDGQLISDLGGLKMDTPFDWIDGLKRELENAKYKVTIPPKLQKLIDADKKRRDRLAK